MLATSNASKHPAMFAGQNCAKRMPSPMPFMCMAAAASITILGTDVTASVSLLALVHTLSLSIAVLGTVLILSCLTGLESLVGLIKGLDPGVMQGD